jgi:DNA-binding Lrp family transcriptional regulator
MYKVYIIISDKEIINNGVQACILIALLDEIDRVMLSYLGKNARISSSQIQRNLLDMGYEITERAIRYRLQRLESDNVILGCSAILNPNLVSEKLNRTITLRFKYSSNSSALIVELLRVPKEASLEPCF